MNSKTESATLSILERVWQDNNNILVSGCDEVIQKYFMDKHFQKVQESGCVHICIDGSCVEDYLELHQQNGLFIKEVLPGKRQYQCRIFKGAGISWVSRLKELLRSSGLQEGEIQHIMSYFQYLQHIDSLVMGRTVSIDEKLITRYSTSMQVQLALQRLVEGRIISNEEHMYLLSKYSELCKAGPELEKVFLNIAYISSFDNDAIWVDTLQTGETIYVKLQAIDDNYLIASLMSMIKWSIVDAMQDKRVAVTVISKEGRWKKEVEDFLRELSDKCYFMYLTDDFFVKESNLKGTFPVSVYSRHSDMGSAQKLESSLGTIPVVKQTYAIDYDRRLASNRLIDRLFKINKVEHYTTTAPTYEPKYLKEKLISMPVGMAIIDYQGKNMFFHI